MEIAERDGHEWLSGHGYPGFIFAGPALAILLVVGIGPAIGCWSVWHDDWNWSSVLDDLMSLVHVVVFTICAGILGLLAIYLVEGLMTWTSRYLIRVSPGAIEVCYIRCLGLFTVPCSIPTASVDEVVAQNRASVGEQRTIDIQVRIGRKKKRVFRTNSSSDAEYPSDATPLMFQPAGVG